MGMFVTVDEAAVAVVIAGSARRLFTRCRYSCTVARQR